MNDFLFNNYYFFNKEFPNSTHKYIIRDEVTEQEINHNRELIKKHFNKRNVSILNQIHSNHVVFIEKEVPLGEEFEADAQVTTSKDIILAIQTADCVPILLESEGVIATIHAGWKSARGGIIKNTVKLMHEKGAKYIKAIIGPSIQQKSYEVDLHFYNNFLEEDEKNSRFFIPSVRKEYYMFDLPGYVLSKLEEENIKDIYHFNDDTYEKEKLYNSFRRANLRGEKYDKTNLLSAICIKS